MDDAKDTPMKETPARINIHVPPDLWQRVRLLAVKQRTTATALLVEWMERGCTEAETKERQG